jgi:hypothetical protein
MSNIVNISDYRKASKSANKPELRLVDATGKPIIKLESKPNKFNISLKTDIEPPPKLAA